ncbi:MAG: alpha/beta hydrolase-fold protein [Bacteroidota bacterium]
MEKILAVSLLLFSVVTLSAQEVGPGKIVVTTFLAPSIQNNRGGEDPLRRLSIYLPPDYDKSNQHYPVVYFLHGFGINDSLVVALSKFDKLMDTAILSRHVRPMIIVFPNSFTRYGGSFYTNSSLTGNWADYIVKDVVDYVDKNFRTIPQRSSRGIAGHSMGGHGALKLAMQYPGIFSSVYALSPAALYWLKEFNVGNKVYQILDTIKDEASVSSLLNKQPFAQTPIDFSELLTVSLARAFSPNEHQPPFFADFPVHFAGNNAISDTVVLRQWETNFPLNMIETHLAALKSFTALKIDWGRNDEFTDIPVTCLQFSKKLEANGVRHCAEEYIGTHVSKLGRRDGRFYAELLLFFDANLKF